MNSEIEKLLAHLRQAKTDIEIARLGGLFSQLLEREKKERPEEYLEALRELRKVIAKLKIAEEKLAAAK